MLLLLFVNSCVWRYFEIRPISHSWLNFNSFLYLQRYELAASCFSQWSVTCYYDLFWCSDYLRVAQQSFRAGFCVLFTCAHRSLKTPLLWYDFPCPPSPNLESAHFPKEPGSYRCRVMFRNHNPEAWCAHWYWGGSQAFLEGRVEKYLHAYLHIGVCAHTVASVFIYLSIY